MILVLPRVYFSYGNDRPGTVFHHWQKAEPPEAPQAILRGLWATLLPDKRSRQQLSVSRCWGIGSTLCWFSSQLEANYLPATARGINGFGLV